MRSTLPISEELDFHYLLSLMPPLHSEPEFAWLPELFSTVGHESLIKLCNHAGGEVIKIPTLQQLNDSISALQWFYDVDIVKRHTDSDIPDDYRDAVNIIRRTYAGND